MYYMWFVVGTYLVPIYYNKIYTIRFCPMTNVDRYKMSINNIGIYKILIRNFHPLVTSFRISKCQN